MLQANLTIMSYVMELINILHRSIIYSKYTYIRVYAIYIKHLCI